MGIFDFLKPGSSNKSSSKTADIIEDKSPKHIDNVVTPVPICPYCKNKLEQMPQRKKKCPHCGNFIHSIKSLVGEEKVLLTESDARDVAFVTEEMKGMDYYGITKDDFAKKMSEMKSERGKDVKPTDVLWRIYSDLNKEAIQKGDLQTIRNMQNSMSMVLYHEGKDFIEPKQEAKRIRLAEYRRIGFDKVRIASPNPCEECAKNIGRVFTITEALKTMPIPNPDCTTKIRDGPAGWCRCKYVAFFDDPELDN